MNIIDSLTDDEILDLTLKKMDKLKMLSSSNDYEMIRKTKSHLHSLIKEVKRRNIKLDESAIAKRILREY